MPRVFGTDEVDIWDDKDVSIQKSRVRDLGFLCASGPYGQPVYVWARLLGYGCYGFCHASLQKGLKLPHSSLTCPINRQFFFANAILLEVLKIRIADLLDSITVGIFSKGTRASGSQKVR
jgi:hypothetical protein